MGASDDASGFRRGRDRRDARHPRALNTQRDGERPRSTIMSRRST